MGRGMLPAHRVRDSRGLSDADWNKTHARVYLPRTDGGYVKAWVKIESGDCFRGQGIVDDQVDSPVKLGTPISYDGGTDSGVLPKLKTRLHRKNKKADLLKGLADSLVNSMQMKNTETRTTRRTCCTYAEHQAERAAQRIAVVGKV